MTQRQINLIKNSFGPFGKKCCVIERAATSKRERKRKKCEWNGKWVFEQVINTMKGNCERLKKIGEERESKKVKEDRERGD